MHPLINVAIKAARLAGREILKSFDHPELIQVKRKGANDWVTDVDVRVEELIIKTIRASYPDHAILGEESGKSATSNVNSDHLWIIDPIDGTVNFAHGLPSFCVSIAVAYRGRVEHGVIFDPIRQELFNASYGEGAFLNNHRIRTTSDLSLTQAMLSVVNGTIESDKPSVGQFLGYYQNLYTAASKIRQQGTVALDCAYVAAGRLDGLAAFNMSYWDLAAGVLLIQEAGGVALDPYSGLPYHDGAHLAAGSYGVVQELQKIINR